MRGLERIAVVSVAIVGMFGCTTLDHKLDDKEWYRKVRDVSVKAADTAADTTAKSLKRMQHYIEEKDLLKTFHDAGEHSEVAVLQVLHKSGVGSAKAGQPKSAANPPKGAAPARPKVGTTPPNVGTTPPNVGTTPKSPQPQSPPALPQQYAGTLRWPLDAGIVSSEYGDRWGKMHKGLDIAADTGEPVYAIAAGEVIYAGDGLHGYGNVVIVRHDNQMTSLYAHNSELKVHQGDQVHQGALLALLGSTGHSTGPHVHFEIREGDAAVNPRTLLPKSKLADVPVESGQRSAAARNTRG
jgi:murein DD-endopeptidase MepM/ murein hydrolase activator NlpD